MTTSTPTIRIYLSSYQMHFAYYPHSNQDILFFSTFYQINTKTTRDNIDRNSIIFSDWTGLLETGSNDQFYEEIDKRIYPNATNTSDYIIDLVILTNDNICIPLHIIDKMVNQKKICKINNISLCINDKTNKNILEKIMCEINEFASNDDLIGVNFYNYKNNYVISRLGNYCNISRKLNHISLVVSGNLLEPICTDNFLVGENKLNYFVVRREIFCEDMSPYEFTNTTFLANIKNVHINNTIINNLIFSLLIKNIQIESIYISECEIKDLDETAQNLDKIEINKISIFCCKIVNSLKTLSKLVSETIEISNNEYLDSDFFDATILNNNIGELKIDYRFDSKIMNVNPANFRKLSICFAMNPNELDKIVSCKSTTVLLSQLFRLSQNLYLDFSPKIFGPRSDADEINNYVELICYLLSNSFNDYQCHSNTNHCYEVFHINIKNSRKCNKNADLISVLSKVAIRAIYFQEVIFDEYLFSLFLDLFSENEYLELLSVHQLNSKIKWNIQETEQHIISFFETNKIFTKFSLDCNSNAFLGRITELMYESCATNLSHHNNKRFAITKALH